MPPLKGGVAPTPPLGWRWSGRWGQGLSRLSAHSSSIVNQVIMRGGPRSTYSGVALRLVQGRFTNCAGGPSILSCRVQRGPAESAADFSAVK
eukprot:gene17890-biopygen20409